jgi:hypothetical protein
MPDNSMNSKVVVELLIVETVVLHFLDYNYMTVVQTVFGIDYSFLLLHYHRNHHF